jgi:hypothetical protein
VGLVTVATKARHLLFLACEPDATIPPLGCFHRDAFQPHASETGNVVKGKQLIVSSQCVGDLAAQAAQKLPSSYL